MANTEALLALQAEYPTAFADPEAAPLGSTGTVLGEAIASNLETMEPEQVRDFAEGHLHAAQAEQKEKLFGSDMTDSQSCLYYIGRINHDPKLLSVAASFLKKLTDIATMEIAASGKKYHSKGSGNLRPLAEVMDEVSAPVLIDLPETHARQGTAECPGGMCPLDH